jgi:hypothetical protein
LPNFLFGNSATGFASGVSTVNFLGNNVTEIGANAFQNVSLTSITIPSSVTSIGASAFTGSGLRIVVMSRWEPGLSGAARITQIGGTNVFGTTGSHPFNHPIFRVLVPLGSLGTAANTYQTATNWSTYWAGTNPRKVIDGSIAGDFIYTTSGTNATVVGLSPSGISRTVLTIPNTVNISGTNFTVASIGNSALNCDRLTSITIPTSITSIGTSAFSNCIALTTVNYNATNPATAGSSIFFNSGTNAQNLTVNIGANVTTIAARLFLGARVTTLNFLGNNVATIGHYAFQDSALTSVRIPASVTSIGQGAFQGATSLRTVVMLRWGGSPNITQMDSGMADIFGQSNQLPFSHADFRIWVPVGSLTTYTSASLWNSYWVASFNPRKIVEGSP